MVKFGILKTKIETLLLESYSNNTFKNEIKTFNKLVLGNKNISKLFYLYDELNSNKGLSESTAKEFVFESITLYENLINKVQNKDIKLIMNWRGDEFGRFIFANGGDQNRSTIGETKLCEELGIELADGLGDKIQSSSWLINGKK